MTLMSPRLSKWHGDESIFLEIDGGVMINMCRSATELPLEWREIYGTGIYFKFVTSADALHFMALRMGDYEFDGLYPRRDREVIFHIGERETIRLTVDQVVERASHMVPGILIRNYFEYLLGVARGEGE